MKPHDTREQQSSSIRLHPDAVNRKKHQRQLSKPFFLLLGIYLFVLLIRHQTGIPIPTFSLLNNEFLTTETEELNRHSRMFIAASQFDYKPEQVPILLCGFAPKPNSDNEKKTWRSYFGNEPTVFSVLYALIWKIPWASRFGKFFEIVPLLISIFWLALWFLVHHFVAVQAQLLGQETSGSFSVLFTEFTQFVYLFCCIQALF